jgi:hypothetical protein
MPRCGGGCHCVANEVCVMHRCCWALCVSQVRDARARAIRKRLGGVLGLGAVVLSHPYVWCVFTECWMLRRRYL